MCHGEEDRQREEAQIQRAEAVAATAGPEELRGHSCQDIASLPVSSNFPNCFLLVLCSPCRKEGRGSETCWRRRYGAPKRRQVRRAQHRAQSSSGMRMARPCRSP